VPGPGYSGGYSISTSNTPLWRQPENHCRHRRAQGDWQDSRSSRLAYQAFSLRCPRSARCPASTSCAGVRASSARRLPTPVTRAVIRSLRGENQADTFTRWKTRDGNTSLRCRGKSRSRCHGYHGAHGRSWNHSRQHRRNRSQSGGLRRACDQAQRFCLKHRISGVKNSLNGWGG